MKNTQEQIRFNFTHTAVDGLHDYLDHLLN